MYVILQTVQLRGLHLEERGSNALRIFIPHQQEHRSVRETVYMLCILLTINGHPEQRLLPVAEKQTCSPSILEHLQRTEQMAVEYLLLLQSICQQLSRIQTHTSLRHPTALRQVNHKKLPLQHYLIQYAVCLTTGPKPLPKRFLYTVRSKASSFK